MGCSSSQLLDAETLEEYQDCTFFTKREIIHVFERYRQLGGKSLEDSLAMNQVLDLVELKENPFKERICLVFSQFTDGEKKGHISFEDFLDMMSVFSEGATRDVKASYAFRIYDFDGDGYLDKKDLMDTIECLCGKDGLSEYERELVADKILEEADLDGDHRLSYVEFEHVISRAPDFVNTFRIRI
ncbi:calcium and integrin-binding protein 2 [Salpingoeca rosetta]|uniref:Calcium and integrin-binding protein 2 n=1 Tax=Salpingoeca rosetta (strain ATCC 50818 / BSB-021) TaxID=946362 RepID=F2UFP0_SALR5|nr:calcium and integrin-binding protein 2 [Salpingoeca rosetta]EGD75608.1 calcium and integrin-binding protein 2 [Salpingoeca rosetta]|eukprot:XP_004992065.1 calcium and integrin-binding protein 2 [Salpingoeca rosetta]